MDFIDKSGVEVSEYCLEMAHRRDVQIDEGVAHLLTGFDNIEAFLIDHHDYVFMKGGLVVLVILNENRVVAVQLCNERVCLKCNPSLKRTFKRQTYQRPIAHRSELRLEEKAAKVPFDRTGQVFIDLKYKFIPQPKADYNRPYRSTSKFTR